MTVLAPIAGLTAACEQLNQHWQRLRTSSIRDLLQHEPDRLTRFSVNFEACLCDFSKQHLDIAALDALLDLARASDIPAAIAQLFGPNTLNPSEKRAALHTALREPAQAPSHHTPDIRAAVAQTNARLAAFTEAIHLGTWRGYHQQAITDVVNIGIGGSDLGAKLATEALAAYSCPHLRVHFVANIDGAAFIPLLQQLNPATTLFIVVSKSFTTLETQCNALAARAWLIAALGEAAVAHHFVAVSANQQAAQQFGIPAENLFPMWDWVGGRFSLWSAVGLSTRLALGNTHFDALLAGAYALDCHLRDTPLEKNWPVLLALIGIWSINICHHHSHAVLPYTQLLAHLPAYLQQLEMESNGKSVTADGRAVTWATAPSLWGEAGVNGQHAFYQHFHQGTHTTPLDFIVAATTDFPLADHHTWLVANCFAQSEALMRGRSATEAEAQMRADGICGADIAALVPHRTFTGNRPSTTMLLPKLDPYHLGVLLALYEHKTYLQGHIWQVNSFDQWGVELGKALANTLVNTLRNPHCHQTHDRSTAQLIAHYHALQTPVSSD